MVRHPAPLGVSTSRNDGWRAGTGEWVAFVDDDDLWAPSKLAEQLRAACEGSTTWVYAGAVNVTLDLHVVGGRVPPPPDQVMADLPRWNVIPGGCSNVMLRRSALETAGGFDPQLVNLADWDLWIRLAQIGAPACVARPLVGYRMHGGNSSLNLDLILREADVIEARYCRPLDRGAIHHYLGWLALRAGRRPEALRQFARAARHGTIAPVAHTMWALAWGAARARTGHPPAASSWRAQAEPWVAALR